jgi:type I restriction enzyme, R subunit
VEGDTKSFTLQYVDWETPANNVFHVTEEFAVERTGSYDITRPDLVLFVNGIPFCVIECKQKGGLEQAITQQIRNQKDRYIPRLYLYSQLLLGLAVDEAKYATIGTTARYWAVWKEGGIDDAVRTLVNRALPPEQKERLFAARERRNMREYFDALEAAGAREPTEQDRAVFALCRPERLLEIARRFVIFDGGEKKIARYQQYFVIHDILARVEQRDDQGRRLGGIVWHTQGSGKSLTMVMLANLIALDPSKSTARIVLVTDRVDLDDQIWNTFRRAGLEPQRARTGRHLVELIRKRKARIITTVIDKFESAVGERGARDESTEIFVFVDESHRGQYGPLHDRMRKTLPNACFIGFTGTPVMKREKNTIAKFGGLIGEPYTIDRAVEDRAVVPLLYEGRHVDQRVDRESIDAWFERITRRLSREQAADLKRKFSTAEQLNKTEQKVRRVAWDISEHFEENWKGTGFKAQLVAQDKATALLYKKYLDEFGLVTSEVLISAPDDREGDNDVLEENREAVVAFWRRIIARFGSEEVYNREIINAFKGREDPEMIIVVDKLLTGFDAPRNTVLYLTRRLKDHTLLQAIARVNRLHEGKDFGYIIDYRGVLAELDSALDLYAAMTEYDREDLGKTFATVAEEVEKLPQRHSDLWDVFKSVPNRMDVEGLERHLENELTRKQFYDRLSIFARTLAIALSTQTFIEQAPEQRVARYKKDLKFFTALRASVQRRYAEVVDFREYERKIQKLLDVHVGTGDVEKVTGLVNIFDKAAFAREVDKLDSDASKADTIAYRTLRTIQVRMSEDPAFYKRFSDLLESAIADFRAQRVSEAEYLTNVRGISERVRDRSGDDVPEAVRYKPTARAFYGILRERALPGGYGSGVDPADLGVEAALKIDEIVEENRIVEWTKNVDVQNRMRNQIDDYLYEVKRRKNIPLTSEDIDEIMEQCLDVAKVQKP